MSDHCGTSNALIGVDSASTMIGEMLQYVGMCRDGAVDVMLYEVPGLLLVNCAMDNDSTRWWWRGQGKWHPIIYFQLLHVTAAVHRDNVRQFGISFGRFGIWSPPGTSTWQRSSSLHGLFAWTSWCPSGITDGLVLGGCFTLANPTPLGMNTTPHAVDCRVFCFRWSWSRGTRITQSKLNRGGASCGWDGTVMWISMMFPKMCLWQGFSQGNPSFWHKRTYMERVV